MKLWQALTRPDEAREVGLTFGYGGVRFPLLGPNLTSPTQKQEQPEVNYVSFATQVLGGCPPVYAAYQSRAMIFSQARFKWRQEEKGRPVRLFGDKSLFLLERPWPGGTTGELLTRIEQDVTLSGNAFVARERAKGVDRLRRLRPDWVTILLSGPPAETAKVDVIGYSYQPGGPAYAGKTSSVLYAPATQQLAPDVPQAIQFAPDLDPLAVYRGRSWINVLIREVMADKAATEHKLAFFENAGTPNLAFSLKEGLKLDAFKKFMQETNQAMEGPENAYKNLFLGGGADVTVVGKDMRQMAFTEVQGAGETRVAMVSGVPAVLLGAKEGLQASTYSNYGQARRKFADAWLQPMWEKISAALEPLIVGPDLNLPGNVMLSYDPDIPILRDDATDHAEIMSKQASALKQLVEAGWEPDSAVEHIVAGDFSGMKHTGLYSVQLQPPNTTMGPEPQPSGNGQAQPQPGEQPPQPAGAK